jgi:hypothetical protein
MPQLTISIRVGFTLRLVVRGGVDSPSPGQPFLAAANEDFLFGAAHDIESGMAQ